MNNNKNNNLVQYTYSSNVDGLSTSLYESRRRSLWSLRITNTLTESDILLIFLQSRVEKLLSWAARD